jgi:hypothetical protein
LNENAVLRESGASGGMGLAVEQKRVTATDHVAGNAAGAKTRRRHFHAVRSFALAMKLSQTTKTRTHSGLLDPPPWRAKPVYPYLLRNATRSQKWTKPRLY